MPAALVWPYEWVILGLWAIAGVLLVLRIPSVGHGPDAHARLLEAHAGR